ncbi:hypothetical protein Tco_0730021 [Tanacetum coccineum]|uniref:Uncharacterized protein n=1 Tax=Tanacetum coccineum TaxID=301880 RepID=A0ABQ4YT19_9ASTR
MSGTTAGNDNYAQTAFTGVQHREILRRWKRFVLTLATMALLREFNELLDLLPIELEQLAGPIVPKSIPPAAEFKETDH